MRSWGIAGLGGLLCACGLLLVLTNYPDESLNNTPADDMRWTPPDSVECAVLRAVLAELMRHRDMAIQTYAYPSRSLFSDANGQLLMYREDQLLDRLSWVGGRLDYCLAPDVASTPKLNWLTLEARDTLVWQRDALSAAEYKPQLSCLIFTDVQVDQAHGFARLELMDFCLHPAPGNRRTVLLERHRSEWRVLTPLGM